MQITMGIPWYYLLIYVAVGAFLLSVFDKFKIIKSKPLRYFTVILIYTLVCLGLYDLIIVHE